MNSNNRQQQPSQSSGHLAQGDMPRRSWFAPIVLVLLVLSLIGNVFLYSEKLQDNKEERTQQGRSIIVQALDAHSMIQGIGSRLETIATTESLETRMIQKQELARFMQRGQNAVSSLIMQADGRDGRTSLTEGDKQAAADFMSRAAAAMIAIGNHEGPLTAEEADYVAMLQESFVTLEEISIRFNFVEEPTGMMALQAAGGGEWISIAYELASAMRTAELQPYNGA